ncbi:hypothetical protein AAC387_Pa05g3185 [Persea americana]
MDKNEIRHRRIRTNGIEMHVAEIGAPKCPLVLLLHGFPELWFSWRHQMVGIAEHGYHVVAPDMRGYGDTESPADSFSYTILHLLGDLIGLLDAFDREKAFVVGHDWGAEVGWHLGLMRPDRVKALVCLSVPFRARSPGEKPTETFARLLGDGFHPSQFQEPGRAEKAFAHYDYHTVMKKFLSIRKPDLIAPPGVELIDFLETPSSSPAWITEEEIQYFASKFQKSGFTGPLNYYRAMDRNWELLAPWDGAKIDVPTKFITGDKDIGFQSFGTKDYILGDVFKSFVPNVEVVIIDGHHYIQQENADVVTNEILSFFSNACTA